MPKKKDTAGDMVEFVEKTKRRIKLSDKGSQYLADIFEDIANRKKKVEDAHMETREFLQDILDFLNTIVSVKVKIKKRPIKPDNIKGKKAFFAYFNNDYSAYAVHDAKTLNQLFKRCSSK